MRSRNRLHTPDGVPGRSKASRAWFVSFLVPLTLAFLIIQSSGLAAQTPVSVLIANSASGEARFKTEFWDWTSRLYRSLVEENGVSPDRIFLLVEDPGQGESLSSPAGKPALVAKATKNEFLKAAAQLRNRASQSETVVIILLGHASYDTDYKFNLIGPDVSGDEIGRYLDTFPTQNVVLVAATPASGILARKLSGQKRVIIAATKSEFEGNHTVFGRFWVEAFEKRAADTDKNGTVSILEAYLYAQKRVAGWYQERQKLATEHSLLEDDGNGLGAAVPSPAGGDGLLAARLNIGRSAAVATLSAAGDGGNSRMRPLLDEKARIEASVQELRYRKSTMAEEDYQKNLEQLLLALARVDSQIRTLEKEKTP
jgi:hypothetical protein